MTSSETAQSQGNPAVADKQWTPSRTSTISLVLASVVALAGVTAVLRAWQLPPFATKVVSTDNAYIRGRTTVISPQVSGYISDIETNDYQVVTKDQEILRIDDRVYRQQVAAAKANLDVDVSNLANNKQTIAERSSAVDTAEAGIASAQAQLVKATADLLRAQELVSSGSGPVSARDTAQAAEDSAKASVREAQAGKDSAQQALKSAQVNEAALAAQVESAKAALEMAEINLSYTSVRAPEDGELSDVTARKGQYVTNGSELVFLVPRVRWVVANFKEAQTANIHLGDRAWFTVDGLDGKRFTGVVERISPATGSEFSVLRTDNAIGNFTKIPQRITVRITIDDNQSEFTRLRPGMSVVAHVDTGSTH